MTVITVDTVGRPLDDDMFADITNAPVVFDETQPSVMTITFDDSDTPLTAQQIAYCRIRVLFPAVVEAVQRSQYDALATHETFAAADPATVTLAQVVAELQLIATNAAQLIRQTQEVPS